MHVQKSVQERCEKVLRLLVSNELRKKAIGKVPFKRFPFRMLSHAPCVYNVSNVKVETLELHWNNASGEPSSLQRNFLSPRVVRFDSYTSQPGPGQSSDHSIPLVWSDGKHDKTRLKRKYPKGTWSSLQSQREIFHQDLKAASAWPATLGAFKSWCG